MNEFDLPLKDKIEKSISLIQKTESLALMYQDFGFHSAFSGGKDSIVVEELMRMSGVKHKTVMNITTLDPPELMKFVRNNYSNIEYILPKINFYKLIVIRGMLPTMKARYCCQVLKESTGAGSVVVTGIRKQESIKRAKRNEIEIDHHKYSNSWDQFNIEKEKVISCVSGKDKLIINPIINWSNTDVWEFIKIRNLKYCELYDQGYLRVGCMFCPMANKNSLKKDLERYPGVLNKIKQSVEELMKKGKYEFAKDSDEVMEWWFSKLSVSSFLNRKKQNKIFFK
jgi:phosphoadenosine phosphosulfate reductase